MKGKICKKLVLAELLFAVLLCALFIGISATTVKADDSENNLVYVNGTYNYEMAYEVLSYVNEERESLGLSALAWSADLSEAAMKRAMECAIDFNHTRPDGTSCFTAITFSYGAAGENIAMCQTSASMVFNSWKNSPGHYANMISSSFTSIGIGCFYHDGTYHWVQLFTNRTYSDTSVANNYTGTESTYVSEAQISNWKLKLKGSSNKEVNLIQGVEAETIATCGYAIVEPETFTWSSSDTSVITVDQNGKIKAVGSGSAIITAKVKTGSASCTLTVNVEPLMFDINNTEILYSGTSGVLFWWITSDEILYVQGSGNRSSNDSLNWNQYADYITSAIVKTSNTTSMDSWFYNLSKLESVNLNQMDTSSVTNMQYTFCSCSALKNLDLSNNDLSSLQYAAYIFYGCRVIEQIKLPSNTKSLSLPDQFMKGWLDQDDNYVTATVENSDSVMTYRQETRNYGMSIYNASSAPLYLGRTNQFRVLVEPSDAYTTGYIWSSSDESIATVDASGNVTGVALGTVTITAIVMPWNYSDSIEVTVKCLHSSVTISPGVPATCTETGLTEERKCSVCGEILAEQEMIPATGHTWNNGVITKDPTETEEGIRTFTCIRCDETRTEVIEKLPETDDKVINVTGISLKDKYLELPVLSTAKLAHAVIPLNATNQTVTWTSSNEKVATVDANGNVTAVSYGRAVITVRTADGGIAASCTIQTKFSDVLELGLGSNRKMTYSTGVNATGYNAIYWAAETGITRGYSDGTFKPTGQVTREEMVTFLYRLAGRPAVDASTVIKFTDADDISSSGGRKAVQWAIANGITKGYSDGTFRPGDPCKRQEIAIFLYRVAKYVGRADSNKVNASTFLDDSKISNKTARTAIYWAVEEGIIKGYTNPKGYFGPEDYCTRQQMVIMMMRFMNAD